MCESKRLFITSVVVNIVLFICLVSIAVHFTNSLSYSADVKKVISYIFISLSDMFYRLVLYTGAKQENRRTEQNNSKAERNNSKAEQNNGKAEQNNGIADHWNKKSEKENWEISKYVFK